MSARLSLLALLALAGAARADVRFVDASLDFEGKLLDQRFVDLAGDGTQALCVALRLAGGGRELRLFELTARGLDPTPVHVVPVLEDVIAYGFADVREEAGRELIFLTRSGAWSYSLTIDGYRGNIRRTVEDDLLYDVPDSRSLPFWNYEVASPGGDLLLLPGRGGYTIWGPRASHEELEAGAASYVALADFWARPHAGHALPGDPGGQAQTSMGEGGFTVTLRNDDSDGVFLGKDSQDLTLLSDSKVYDAPALIDVNGDGAVDMVASSGGELRVHLAVGGVIPREPTRIEKYPEYLNITNGELSLRFTDLDGDGLLDLGALIEEEIEGFENGAKRLLILINDGRRLLPEEPRQVLRFEAAILRWGAVDVNQDGKPDIVMRKFDLPSMLQTVTGLEFRLTHLVFLAEPRGKALFERRPALKQTQVFNENTVGEAIKNRRLELDCDGDEIPDLVEVDLQGRIVIRRLTFSSGFFSGDTWALDEDPWKRFETRGTTLTIEVDDVNGDGLCDILSPGESSLTLYLSQRTR